MLAQAIAAITDEEINVIEHDFKVRTGNYNFSFNDERRTVLRALNSIDVNACPGSGKTTMIAAKLLILSKKWPYRRRGVCVLSHTNAAKDEIIDKLKQHPNAHQFLGYPHFIGTMQEFAHRYLSLPYLRSQGINVFHIDNDEYVAHALKLLGRNQFSWLRGTLNGLGADDNQENFFRETYYEFVSGQMTVHINKQPQTWRDNVNNLNRAKRDLLQLKVYMRNDGIFLFRDMFTFAELAIIDNDKLCKRLRHKFPLLLIDEMQDTENFQDDLLQKLFPLGRGVVSSVQRFGDTNQAIFHRYGLDENSSFPDSVQQARHDITLSHRFGGRISELAQALALDKGNPRICTATENAPYNEKPVLIAFVRGAELQIRDQFIELIKQKLPSENHAKLKIYAVAASAKKKENGLRLVNYFPEFDRKYRTAQFIPNTLCEAIFAHKDRESLGPANFCILFHDIWKSLCRHLRLQGHQYADGGKAVYYTSLSLQRAMQDYPCESYNNFLNRFRALVWGYIDVVASQDGWQSLNAHVTEIMSLLTPGADISSWIKYKADSAQELQPAVANGSSFNVYERDGLCVHIDTIHGVKGQTHDVTLVMETQFHKLDWGSAAQAMHFSTPPGPTPKTRRIHMKGLFVGCSRPSKLLCVAVTQETANVLQKKFPDLFEVFAVRPTNREAA